MKVKFSKFERVAGLFVLAAFAGGLALCVGVALKRGWFDAKVMLVTLLPSADGIHVGTQVQMSGLRIGDIEEIELKANNNVEVHFEVSKRYLDRIRKDSALQLVRPFLIGEKVIDITSGSDTSEALRDGSFLEAQDSVDFMDLLSGRKLGPYLSSIGKMSENLKMVAEALLDKDHFRDFVKMMGEIKPLVTNMSSLTKEANILVKGLNKDERMIIALNNLVEFTNQMNKALPYISKEAPQLAEDLTKISHNMASLTDELQKILPVFDGLAPEIPHASRRAIEALDETVITLKALQKSFLLRGNVRDVKEEEEKARLPATDPKAEKQK